MFGQDYPPSHAPVPAHGKNYLNQTAQALSQMLE
jgi:hypothetical protein